METSSVPKCTNCGEENTILNDQVSGDCVCVSCGVVDNRDCQFQISYDNSTHVSGSVIDHELLKKISSTCKRFKLINTLAFFTTIHDFYKFNHAVYDIKEIICASYLVEEVLKNRYLTDHITHKWAKKMKVSVSEVHKLIAIFRQNDHHHQEVNEKTLLQWDLSLKEEVTQLIQMQGLEMNHKDKMVLVKKCRLECARVISTKQNYIFHSIEYLAAAIVVNFVDQLLNTTLNMKKIENIRRMIYD